MDAVKNNLRSTQPEHLIQIINWVKEILLCPEHLFLLFLLFLSTHRLKVMYENPPDMNSYNSDKKLRKDRVRGSQKIGY